MAWWLERNNFVPCINNTLKTTSRHVEYSERDHICWRVWCVWYANDDMALKSNWQSLVRVFARVAFVCDAVCMCSVSVWIGEYAICVVCVVICGL